MVFRSVRCDQGKPVWKAVQKYLHGLAGGSERSAARRG